MKRPLSFYITAFIESAGSAFAKPERKCLLCGYKGQMKTWLLHYNFPQLLSLVLLLAGLIPGLLFIAWGWKKYKCPMCGALAKSVPVTFVN